MDATNTRVRSFRSVADAIFSLGANFLYQGKYDKALTIFNGLMALEPEQLKPATAYGEALLLAGRAERALNHFFALSKQFDLDSRTLLLTAKACIMLGKPDEARKLLTMIAQGEISATKEEILSAQSILTLSESASES